MRTRHLSVVALTLVEMGSCFGAVGASAGTLRPGERERLLWSTREGNLQWRSDEADPAVETSPPLRREPRAQDLLDPVTHGILLCEPGK